MYMHSIGHFPNHLLFNVGGEGFKGVQNMYGYQK